MFGGCARHRGVTGGIVGDPKLPRWRLRVPLGHFRVSRVSRQVATTRPIAIAQPPQTGTIIGSAVPTPVQLRSHGPAYSDWEISTIHILVPIPSNRHCPTERILYRDQEYAAYTMHDVCSHHTESPRNTPSRPHVGLRRRTLCNTEL